MCVLNKVIACFLFLFCILCFGCSDANERASQKDNTSKSNFSFDLGRELNLPDAGLYFKDNRDNHIYKAVKIGNQFWMAENLNFETDDSWCYRDSSAYCENRGRLYTWQSAKKSCLEGWRLPSNDDWATLQEYVGCPYRKRSCAGYRLKKSTGWQRAVDTPVGSDEFGFSGVPGGMRFSDGRFADLNEHSYLWSATEADSVRSYVWDLWYNSSGFYASYEQEMGKDGNKNNAFSVRCVKN